jgi:hypothetical protein
LTTRFVRRVLTGLAAAASLCGILVVASPGASDASPASPERLVPADHRPAGARLAAGPHGLLATYYKVVNQRNNECLMTTSWVPERQLETRDCGDSRWQQHQKWTFRYGGYYNGFHYYEVVNAYNDMCMSVQYASTSDWAEVQQAGCRGSGHYYQLWKLVSVGGYYELVALHSDKCLDISWGKAIQFGCNGATNQHFHLR